MSDYEPQADPLFRGLTRSAMVVGVPVFPLVIMVGSVLMIGLWTKPYAWFIGIPLYITMRIIVKHDDKAFRIWGLWIETKLMNKRKFKRFWGASTYSPRKYTRK